MHRQFKPHLLVVNDKNLPICLSAAFVDGRQSERRLILCVRLLQILLLFWW